MGRLTNHRRELQLHYFTYLEARLLAVLPKKTPALVAMVEARDLRRARFEKIAARKVYTGAWRRGQIRHKWLLNLNRMYTRRNWRVQHGATGDQPKLPRGSPNPWAMYRSFIKNTGGDKGQGWVSPWQLRTFARKTTGKKLNIGQLFVQRAERGSGVSQTTLRNWVDSLDASAKASRGKRRERLVAQRDKLKRLL